MFRPFIELAEGNRYSQWSVGCGFVVLSWCGSVVLRAVRGSGGLLGRATQREADMVEQNEYGRGYDAAYAEIRTAIRDNDHPSVFVCQCPACEVVAELLQGIADTMNLYLTKNEAELFSRLLQAVEERQDVGNWPSLVIENEPSPRLDQKMTPE